MTLFRKKITIVLPNYKLIELGIFRYRDPIMEGTLSGFESDQERLLVHTIHRSLSSSAQVSTMSGSR